MSLQASVIITTYLHDRVSDCFECIDGVLEQKYGGEVEVVVMADASQENTSGETVYDRIKSNYSDIEIVNVVADSERHRLSAARNIAADFATGDVYIFIDDDVVPSGGWLPKIMERYEDTDDVAVGGPAEADWKYDRPWYLPDEMLWLVGVTHRGFADGEGYVRNTFGCNISFRADVFEEVGGFDEDLGKKHGKNIQGEETELSERVFREYGKRVYYLPEASVSHKVFESQLHLSELINRAYYQGYTKALFSDDATDTESDYLWWLLGCAIPNHVLRLEADDVVGNLMFTSAVGIGYIVGKLRT